MSSPSRPPIPESPHADRLAEERTSEPQPAGLRLDRRGFLQAAGFSLAAATTGCHRPPLQSARPYLEAPEHVVPGRALHYASVCGGCSAACGTLVKVRDGRPIKMEGLDEHPGSRGGLCALGQASLLGLYDALRIQGPKVDGRDVSWQEADAAIRQALASARRSGRAIRLLTPTLPGPTDRAAASRFVAATGGAHVVHDPLSASAILDAHLETHGRRVLPRYRFDRADVVVSLDADFLGIWISPVEHAAAYQRRRHADGTGATRPSHHVQIESRLSLSGCNADRRLVVDPADFPAAVAILERAVAARSGSTEDLASPPAPSARTLASAVEHELVAALEDLADLLWQTRKDGGQALVICDCDDVDAQILVNALNHRLGGYGTTVDLERPSLQRQGDDRAFAELLAELDAGDVGVLLVAGVDPLHELEGLGLAENLRSVDLLVSLSPHLDATTAAADVVCPTPHFLESWGDAEPVAGWLAVRQPAIAPLFDVRSLRAGLDLWSADETYEDRGDLQAVRDHWREEIHPRDPRGLDFESFWNRTVHDGFVELPTPATLDDPVEPLDESASAAAAEAIANRRAERPSRAGDLTLLLYPKVGLGDGRHADNPWLHELPDPVSKVTWGNYACLSPKAAADLGVSDGDVVRVRHGQTHLELPALVQPGQHDTVVAVAMGYGDPRTVRFRDVGPHWISSRPSTGPDGRVGVNGARLRGGLSRRRHGVTVEATGERRELACTQRWDRQDLPEETSPSGHGERHFVRAVSLASLATVASGKHASATAEDDNGGEGAEHGGGGRHHATLYPADHAPENGAGRATPHWGMTIDLDACTGCSACVVACQAENNLPVVGYDEVRRHRDMHWLRIDRYYDGDVGGDEAFDVAFQPMLCQHCDQAPCETVCPVLATVQTEEGLNAQAYNRCVGTRYCANNCPFKVRRFNWFDYRRDDPVANLVLNPDVVVRTRGVMEKCSFCVQRIEYAKIEARRRGETRVREDEVRPACQQTCPADAIRFGDVRDADSRVAESRRSPRSYTLLDELNVYPSVDYLSRVRRGVPETNDEQEPRHG